MVSDYHLGIVMSLLRSVVNAEAGIYPLTVCIPAKDVH